MAFDSSPWEYDYSSARTHRRWIGREKKSGNPGIFSSMVDLGGSPRRDTCRTEVLKNHGTHDIVAGKILRDSRGQQLEALVGLSTILAARAAEFLVIAESESKDKLSYDY